MKKIEEDGFITQKDRLVGNFCVCHFKRLLDNVWEVFFCICCVCVCHFKHLQTLRSSN
jgi:hypothetical protein